MKGHDSRALQRSSVRTMNSKYGEKEFLSFAHPTWLPWSTSEAVCTVYPQHDIIGHRLGSRVNRVTIIYRRIDLPFSRNERAERLITTPIEIGGNVVARSASTVKGIQSAAVQQRRSRLQGLQFLARGVRRGAAAAAVAVSTDRTSNPRNAPTYYVGTGYIHIS